MVPGATLDRLQHHWSHLHEAAQGKHYPIWFPVLHDKKKNSIDGCVGSKLLLTICIASALLTLDGKKLLQFQLAMTPLAVEF